jgi:hypothetical protein
MSFFVGMEQFPKKLLGVKGFNEQRQLVSDID